MNEFKIMKKSLKVACLGLIISIITSIITSNISFILGFLVGYIINVMIFYLIIQTSTLILEMQVGTIGFIIVLYIIKLLLYALGFYLAFKYPSVFNAVAVFIGYFVIKITIYIQTYRNRGGDMDG